MPSPIPQNPLNVLIAGGGVAGLEAALALRALAREAVRITLLAPEAEFVYRPLAVGEPFARPAARRYPLEAITAGLDIEPVRDAFRWLDPEARTVHTENGERLRYDALLLALGARPHPSFPHGLTLDVHRLDEQLHGLVQDVESGYVQSLAFVVPDRLSWPLPAYELALMTAGRAYGMGTEVTVTVITPEESPLAVFGRRVSSSVQRLLRGNGVQVFCASQATVRQPGELSLHPGDRRLRAEQVVAMPELFGPPTPGVPKRDPYGFISVDSRCRVIGLQNVFAAGDATDFPIKFGGVASQQADVAAQAIAALAGTGGEPAPFAPTLRGILLGGRRPLYMSARFAGAHGTDSQVSEAPLWAPEMKIVARHLGPRLEELDPTPVG
jgi:sulfide:quinone oxidoreductase